MGRHCADNWNSAGQRSDCFTAVSDGEAPTISDGPPGVLTTRCRRPGQRPHLSQLRAISRRMTVQMTPEPILHGHTPAKGISWPKRSLTWSLANGDLTSGPDPVRQRSRCRRRWKPKEDGAGNVRREVVQTAIVWLQAGSGRGLAVSAARIQSVPRMMAQSPPCPRLRKSGLGSASERSRVARSASGQEAGGREVGARVDLTYITQGAQCGAVDEKH